MKYQGFEKRNLKILALITAVMMLMSVFSVFPVMAAGSGIAAQTEIEVDDGGSDTIGTAYPGYVVLDAADVYNNLEKNKVVSVEKASWHYVDYKLMDATATDPAITRISVLNADNNQPNKDPYIGLDIGNCYSADTYKYVTLVVRVDDFDKEGIDFRMFYDTKGTGYVGGKSVTAKYQATLGYEVLTFDFTNAPDWEGDIRGLRLDIFDQQVSTGSYVDIVAMVLCADGEAVYESSYSIMESLYKPVQVLKDFAEEDLDKFTVGANGTNKVSIVDGNVLYGSVYSNALNSRGEVVGYSDPYAGFRYDLYIDAKNEGLEENDPNRLQMLTPEDFQYVVLKVRKSLDIEMGIQLFAYTNGGSAHPGHAPAGSAKRSDNYGWRAVTVNFDSGYNKDYPEYQNRWTAEDTVFNGFRVDWAGTGTAGAFCEIDEILFFKNDFDAYDFSSGLNNIPAPSDFNESSIPDEGETYIPTPAGDTYSVYSFSDILSMNNTVENGFFSVTTVDGVDAAALLSDGAGAPSVTLFPDGIGADNYETLAFAVKFTGSADETFDLVFNYKTSTMTQADQAHKLIAEDIKGGTWQIVSFDLSAVSDWSGNIEQITLECLSESGDYAQGFGMNVQSAGFCFYPEDAAEFAKYTSEMINAPVQVLSNFNGGDLGYFNQGTAATNVTISNGNLKFTATAQSSDPYSHIHYKKYMKDSVKYKAITTEDFNYITIKYRADNIEAKMAIIELFILDENYQPILRNPENPKDYSCYVSRKVKYIADGEWHAITIDMTNGGQNESVWQGEFNGVRFDWCNEITVNPASYFEVSEMLFFATKEEAESYESVVNNVSVVVGEDVVHIPEESETLPSFPDGEEESSETLPIFPGNDSTEETTETLPEFPNDSEESGSDSVEESSDVNSEITSGEDDETESQFGEDSNTETETTPQFTTEIDTDTETETMPQFTIETDTDTEIETMPQFTIETDTESDSEWLPDDSENVGGNTGVETTDDFGEDLTGNEQSSSETEDESDTELGSTDEITSEDNVASDSENSIESSKETDSETYTENGDGETESDIEDDSTGTDVVDTENDDDSDVDTDIESGSESGSDTDVESGSESGSDTDAESGSESDTQSGEESDTGSDTETEPESDTGTDTTVESSDESDTETGTESDTEEETEGKLPGGIDKPIKPNVNGDVEDTATKGSQIPFLIACGVLASFSVASIGIVIYIKIRMKYFS